MRYEIIRSDGVSSVIIVEEDSINTYPDLSIDLVGHKKKNYGQTIATTQVKLLENFASEYEPNDPIPGQFWYFKGTTDCATDTTKCPRLKINMGTGDGNANANWVDIATLDDVGASVLGELDDVELFTPYYDPISNTGHVLTYDVHYQRWTNAPIPTPKLYLEELRNVSYGPSLQTDQILSYQNGVWTNTHISSIERNLGDLSDVVVTNPTLNDAILFTGTDWVNRSLSELIDLSDLKDVTLTSNKQTGQALIYDGSTWKNDFPSLNKLFDVSVPNPQNGQSLVYDSLSGTWIAKTVSGGGGGGVSSAKDSTGSGISVIQNGIPDNNGDIYFNRIRGGSSINVTESNGDLVIDYTGGSGGSGVTGASNLGGQGIGTYASMSGGILYFRNIYSPDSSISVNTDGTGNIQLTASGGSTTANLGDLNDVTDHNSNAYNLMYDTTGSSGDKWKTGPYKLEWLSNVSNQVAHDRTIIYNNSQSQWNPFTIKSHGVSHRIYNGQRSFSVNTNGVAEGSIISNSSINIIETDANKNILFTASGTLVFTNTFTGTPGNKELEVRIYMKFGGGITDPSNYFKSIYEPILLTRTLDNTGSAQWSYPPIRFSYTIDRSNISGSLSNATVSIIIQAKTDGASFNLTGSCSGILVNAYHYS